MLRETDRLFAILAAQRHQLAQLASDSEEILGPLSRERAHVAGFLANSGAAAQASSERGPELEASLRKFPRFLREFRLTMRSLQGFSDAGTPVFSYLDKAAPSLTDATKELAPFSEASTVALKSLGQTGEVAGPLLREADPIVRKTTELSKTGVAPTTNLAKFLVNTKKTGGWGRLVKLIYNTTAAINGFDQYGHFARTLVTLTNCVDYEVHPGCGGSANFTGPGAATSATTNPALLYRKLERDLARQSGGTAASSSSSSPSGPGQSKTGGTAPLLNYLLGP